MQRPTLSRIFAKLSYIKLSIQVMNLRMLQIEELHTSEGSINMFQNGIGI